MPAARLECGSCVLIVWMASRFETEREEEERRGCCEAKVLIVLMQSLGKRERFLMEGTSGGGVRV